MIPYLNAYMKFLKGTSMSRKNNHQKHFSEKNWPESTKVITSEEQELDKLSIHIYREFSP